MKYFSILILFAITFLSCNKRPKSNENSTSTNQKVGEKFFDYDEIDYYKIDFDEEKIDELYDNQSKTEIDSIKMGIILDDIPSNISDLTFINKLENIGYKKSKIDESKFKNIDKIFIEKTIQENIATACIYIYRDILIFKKERNIVGTAKICFDCLANQIKGSKANTENFGQDGDYEKLAKILNQ